MSGFGTTQGQLLEKINSFSGELELQPMASDDRTLSAEMLREALGSAVGAASLRPLVLPALAAAFSGDPAGMIQIADVVTGRQLDGTYDTTDEANRAIRCADDPTHYTVDDVKSQVAAYQAASETFGEAAAWDGLRCLDWPVPGDNAAK